MIHCGYHNDPDGQVAAHLLHERLAKDRPDELALFTPLDSVRDAKALPVSSGDELWLLDYSFPPDVMSAWVTSGVTIVWIDHHVSAIEAARSWDDSHTALKALSYLPGIRHSGKYGACALTWMYLCQCGTRPAYVALPCSIARDNSHCCTMPKLVRLVSDYDTWTFEVPGSEAFNAAIRLLDLTPGSPDMCVMSHNADVCHELVEDGMCILSYVRGRDSADVKANAYEVVIDGLRCLALNTLARSSKRFASVDAETLASYDALCCYSHGAKGFSVSLYSSGKDVDILGVARRRGGGGHAKACGFTSSTLPWDAEVPNVTSR